jgi:uncharacterized lipoprotein YddW (UPF0748 family)
MYFNVSQLLTKTEDRIRKEKNGLCVGISVMNQYSNDQHYSKHLKL